MSPTEWLLATQLQDPRKLIAADVVFALLCVGVLLPALRSGWRSPAAWRKVGLRAGIAAVTALVLLVVCWVIDATDVFGVALSPVNHMWIALAGAGLALAVTGIVQGGRWRRTAAIVLLPLALLVPALGINVEFAQYPTLGTVVQTDPYARFDAHAAPLETMPATGRVNKVVIPGTVSHFHARPAVVYLPPAALVADPPALPVVLAFAGQPGAPGDMFTAGQMAKPLDAYAAAHHGRAPIVVSVDQLSAPGRNTMCVDSKLGNADTYVTQDVPAWIRTHLPATTDRRAWGLVGFSQGATCAMQFLTGHPQDFSAALAISSELQPIDQSPQHSADQAFGGSVAAWKAAAPISLMRADGPFPGHRLWMTAGSADREFSRNAERLAHAAELAGIRTTVASAPHSGHDWNTVQWSLRTVFPAELDALSAAQR
ncbi:esterase family protein [Curtobacterium sp. ISL-83]|uniref:alpha/beta hydrolase n=1 Tax=Curtobacterium sp. ISL-83 TaxID=2819145 RepID=UPI001BEC9BEF|nr:alpha/beta hydrolase-fold protein [Curtobacterium sp. ISL-83]MBT2502556.1 hypothetical protein [Curtobacterium sp. ISL-83]